jgi:hypothetical protein
MAYARGCEQVPAAPLTLAFGLSPRNPSEPSVNRAVRWVELRGAAGSIRYTPSCTRARPAAESDRGGWLYARRWGPPRRAGFCARAAGCGGGGGGSRAGGGVQLAAGGAGPGGFADPVPGRHPRVGDRVGASERSVRGEVAAGDDGRRRRFPRLRRGRLSGPPGHRRRRAPSFPQRRCRGRTRLPRRDPRERAAGRRMVHLRGLARLRPGPQPRPFRVPLRGVVAAARAGMRHGGPARPQSRSISPLGTSSTSPSPPPPTAPSAPPWSGSTIRSSAPPAWAAAPRAAKRRFRRDRTRIARMLQGSPGGTRIARMGRGSACRIRSPLPSSSSHGSSSSNGTVLGILPALARPRPRKLPGLTPPPGPTVLLTEERAVPPQSTG